MTSLEIHGRRSGLSSLIASSVLPLILIGFVATTGTAFWSYTRSSPPSVQTTLPKANANPDLLCECSQPNQPDCWVNSGAYSKTQPAMFQEASSGSSDTILASGGRVVIHLVGKLLGSNF